MMTDMNQSGFGGCGAKANPNLSEATLTSRALAGRYPVKGSMPTAVVHQLYQLREREVEALRHLVDIKEADLRRLDRIGRAVVAGLLFEKCDDAARHALLHDEHAHVRSSAERSKFDMEEGVRSSI